MNKKRYMTDNAETFVWINDLLYLNMGIRVSPLLINSSISMIVFSKKKTAHHYYAPKKCSALSLYRLIIHKNLIDTDKFIYYY